MANEINIGINTTSDLSGLNQVDESVKSLKTQLKEAQANVAALSDKFGATSKEAVEAAKSAAILKDKIGDAKALTDAFNPDAKFKAVSASLAGVAGGFSAVQGAMGLFGEESKDVEKAILKVQSAMALASGIQAIGESIDSFKQMKAVAVNAFNAIKGAIGASGIGLLVVALGTIYAYWDDIKAAVSGVSSEQKKLNKSAEDNLKTQKSKLDTINAQDATMKLQGKSEKEILKIKLAQTNQVITASEVQLKNNIATTKAQVEASKRNKEILKGTLEFLTAPLALLLDGVDAVGKALGKNFGLKEGLYGGIAKLVFNPDEIQKEADITNKALEKELITLKNTRDSLTLQIRDVDKKASDEQQKKREEQQEKREQERLKEQQRLKDQAEKDKNILNQSIKEREDMEADSATKKAILQHNRRLQEINEIKDFNLQKKALEEEEAINTKRMADAMDADKEAEYNKSVEFMNLEDGNFESSLQKQLEHYEHLKTIQQDYGKSTIEVDKQILKTKEQIAEEEKKIELAKLEMRREVTNKTIAVAGQAGQFLQEIAGKSKGVAIGGIIVEKAASIAGIISSTAQANAQFLANPVSAATLGTAAISPIALNNISAGISIASILAQSAKSIAEINGAKSSDAVGGGQQTPSKFATGGLVTGMGTSTSDSIIANLSNGESVINAKSTAMFGNLLSNINQAGGGVAFGNQNNANPIFKTYVVASEMTSQIEANLKLKQIARL